MTISSNSKLRIHNFLIVPTCGRQIAVFLTIFVIPAHLPVGRQGQESKAVLNGFPLPSQAEHKPSENDNLFQFKTQNS